MKSKYSLVALLALTIALAGCTQLPGQQGDTNEQPYTFTQDDGLSISFSAANAEWFEGDGTATFTASFENTGEASTTVNPDNLELFGASWAVGTSPDRDSSSELQPVERENNLPGGQTSFTFRPSLPSSLGAGQSDTYEVGLETTYSYTSETRSSLTVMSDEKFQESRGSVSTMENTVRGAPLQVRFTANSPRPARGSTISIPIEIQNVGDGEVTGDVSLSPSVEGSTDIGFSCPDSVSLFEGQRTVTCTVDDISTDVVETSYTLRMVADYDYVERDTTTVTVIGEGENADGGNGENNEDDGDGGGDEPGDDQTPN